MSSLSAPVAMKLDDEKAEAVRADLVRKIVELQGQPFVIGAIISDVRLVDGVATQVAHRLQRKPKWAAPSFVRGAVSTGRIDQGAFDDKFITLTATGFGATVTIDLAVA